VAFEVAGEPVAARDGGARDHQLHRHGPADVVADAHDGGIHPAHGPVDVRQQHHHALRRAGTQTELAQRQPADVLGVEAVDVLLRPDRVDQLVRVEVGREWELHEDPVHRGVGIEALDEREQSGLGRVGRQVAVVRAEPDPQHGLALVAHVDA
jgi:hypothetical protein